MTSEGPLRQEAKKNISCPPSFVTHNGKKPSVVCITLFSECPPPFRSRRETSRGARMCKWQDFILSYSDRRQFLKKKNIANSALPRHPPRSRLPPRRSKIPVRKEDAILWLLSATTFHLVWLHRSESSGGMRRDAISLIGVTLFTCSDFSGEVARCCPHQAAGMWCLTNFAVASPCANARKAPVNRRRRRRRRRGKRIESKSDIKRMATA